jgi:fatty-acyl-CoA synthase
LLPRTLGEAFTSRFGIPVHQGYGMTECAGLIAVTGADAAPTDAIGRAVPGVEVGARRLLPDGTAGEFVPPGEIGLLVVRGPNVFPGYLDDAPAPFTKDGWLITGDIGSVAEDGLVRITGRAKDLIIRSGHNIDPAVIEDAAARHPLVVTSAAVGRPDAYAGETPMLYVVLRDESPDILADLQAHLERSVPEPPARPKSIVPVRALPVTTVGKIDKVALRRDAAVRAARDALQTVPALARLLVDITSRDNPSGRILVEATVVGSADTDLAAVADRLLSRFPFDHRLIVREAGKPI